MCNEAYRRIQIGQLREGWSQLKIPLRFPEGIPNFAPQDSIRITDRIEIVRAAGEAPGEAEMVTRRWSWPVPGGKRPVYNVRSDGRALPNGDSHGRCLIPVDGFYEFTDPPGPDLLGTPAAPPRAAKKPLKSKWAFTLKGHDWFAIGGVWRRDAGVPDATGEGVGEAWAMLTCPPGPDIAPYHDRQVVVLRPADFTGWLTGETPAADLCQPLPAGTLEVTRVR